MYYVVFPKLTSIVLNQAKKTFVSFKDMGNIIFHALSYNNSKDETSKAYALPTEEQ